MDPVDRLAAYLADELHADERAQLEVELRRDPELRRTLEAMQRADDALAQLPAATPPEGFDERLDAVVDATLAELLGRAGEHTVVGHEPDPAGNDGTDTDEPVDELAARRRRRVTSGVLGAAAAGLILVVGGILAVQTGGDHDRADQDAAGDVMMESFDADSDPTDESADSDDAADDGAADDDGPVIVDEGRVLDAGDLETLLDADVLVTLASQQLDEAAGTELAERFQLRFHAANMFSADDREAPDAPETNEDLADQDSDDAAEPDEEPDEEPEPEGEEDVASRPGALDADPSTVIARCLAVIHGTDPTAIPAYGELATVDGVDAVILGVVVADPDTGRFDHREVWVLDRDSCQVLRTLRADSGAG